MKDCNEIARGLLARRDEYRKKQRRRKKAAIAAAACFCLIAGGCIGLWQGGVFSPAENSGKEDVYKRQPIRWRSIITLTLSGVRLP